MSYYGQALQRHSYLHIIRVRIVCVCVCVCVCVYGRHTKVPPTHTQTHTTYTHAYRHTERETERGRVSEGVRERRSE